jgi:hypothetical protein
MAKRAFRKGKFRKYPEKSAVMNFRITPGTRQLLEQAAVASGRTISSECEHQLQRALSDMSAGPSHAIMTIIGRAIDDLVVMRKRGERLKGQWWNDPYTFDAAARAVVAAFEIFRPKGEAPDTGRQGEFTVEAILREIQLIDLSVPFDQMTPHQRWLALLKRDLGTLAERSVIWGENAEQARERRKHGLEILRELIPLSRKPPGDLTPEEAQRLQDLRNKAVQ